MAGKRATEIKSEKNKNEAAPKKIDNKNAGFESTTSVVKFDPLQRYLSEISQYRLLTREEEVELGNGYRRTAIAKPRISW